MTFSCQVPIIFTDSTSVDSHVVQGLSISRIYLGFAPTARRSQTQAGETFGRAFRVMLPPGGPGQGNSSSRTPFFFMLDILTAIRKMPTKVGQAHRDWVGAGGVTKSGESLCPLEINALEWHTFFGPYGFGMPAHTKLH